MSALALPHGLLEWMADAGISTADLARACGVERSVLSRLINHGRWPVRTGRRLHARLVTWLAEHGPPSTGSTKEKAPKRTNASRPDVPPTTKAEGDKEMLPPKVSLTPQARQHFGIARDPFTDCREPADVFLSPETLYVREAIHSAVKHNGYLAVVGESGSGKTTLLQELQERVHGDNSVALICPYVVGMERKDPRGRSVRAANIASAIMRTLAPHAAVKSSADDRFAQIHQTLIESHRSGVRNVIAIEEAHDLPTPTLRHLKRYLELKDRMRPLVSIVLFGQPELERKLRLVDADIREVSQRLEVIHLPPLGERIGEYVKHRLARIGVDSGKVVDASGVDGLRDKLVGDGTYASTTYPLAVNNLLAAGMNAAASLGAPLVTRDIVVIAEKTMRGTVGGAA